MSEDNDYRYHLFVLRHGKASSDTLGRDFERTLTDKGVEQAEKIGDWMYNHDLIPDFVLTSPATRALMTSNIVSKKLNIKQANRQVFSQIYEANLDTLLKVLNNCPLKNHKVLLVGHNPTLEYLVDYLLPASITLGLKNDDRLFPATLAHIKMNVPWSQLAPNCAEGVSITHGKLLS